MRFLRFSLRRLMVLVGVVAALLYGLYLRPIAIAEQFVREMETAKDLAPLSDKYFDGMASRGATVTGYLQDQTWANLVGCRREIALRLERPAPSDKNRVLISRHRYYSTPFGIRQEGAGYIEESRVR